MFRILLYLALKIRKALSLIMASEFTDYNLFFRFIETYAPLGFKGIDREDPLILELEEMMEKSKQFFYIADIIQIKFLFTSKGSARMIGIEPDDLSPYHFMEATHPDDIQRLNIGRTKVIKMAQDLFIAEAGSAMLSTNFKIRTPGGAYSEFLIQSYMLYTAVPYKTVFFLKIHTKIDWYKKLKHGYHYYVGDKLSHFRYPDEALMQMGNVFTKREFEIIRMIESCMSTEQIAEKLFLSVYTVNTHRSNILKKSNKANISELIYELKERGVI